MLAALYSQQRRLFGVHATESGGRVRVTFVSRTLSFPGAGGVIGGFGCSLPSAATLQVCVPADGKTSTREIFVFALPPFNFPELDVWAKWRADVSLISKMAYMV